MDTQSIQAFFHSQNKLTILDASRFTATNINYDNTTNTDNYNSDNNNNNDSNDNKYPFTEQQLVTFLLQNPTLIQIILPPSFKLSYTNYYLISKKCPYVADFTLNYSDLNIPNDTLLDIYSYYPNLHSIHINGNAHDDRLLTSEYYSTIKKYCPHITTLTTTHSLTLDTSLIIMTYFTDLTHLTLHDPMSVTCIDIISILNKCSNITTFSCLIGDNKLLPRDYLQYTNNYYPKMKNLSLYNVTIPSTLLHHLVSKVVNLSSLTLSGYLKNSDICTIAG